MKKFIAGVLILTFTLSSLPARADDFGVEGGETQGLPANPSPGQTACKGDAEDPTCSTKPVILDRGEEIYRKQDLFLPGMGLNLELSRTYRSNSVYHSQFGFGWDINYNMKIRKMADGTYLFLTGTNRKEPISAAGNGPAGFYDHLEPQGDGTYILKRKHGEKVFFDINGNATRIEDRAGNYLALTYDPAGKLPLTGPSKYFVSQPQGVIALEYRLTRVEDALGRFFDFFYDVNGRLDHVTDSAGRTVTYGYDANNDLKTITTPPVPEYPAGLITTYSYDSDHRLTTIKDAKDQIFVTNVYTQGKVTSQTLGADTTTLVYDTVAKTTDVTNRRGFRTLWTFSSEGRPIKKEEFTDGLRPGDPPKYETTYEYDANGELQKTTFPKGNSIQNTYDSVGNLLEIRRKPPTGSLESDIITTFTYEPQFNLIKTITDPRLNVTTYTYDYELAEPAKGLLRKITYPQVDGETIETVFTYNAFGQIETVTDPNGNVTQYTYNPVTGYLETMTQGFGSPEASTTTFGYDIFGNVSSIQDGRGNTTTYEYNALNQLKKVIAPAPFNFETRYAYDENGNLKELKRQSDLSGTTFQITTYTYTLLNQLETIKDHNNNITTFEYDANGNRKKIIDAELKATNYLYDERDLLFTVTDANTGVTTYGYDSNGNLASIKDANTNITQYQYDDFDRLEKTIYPDLSEENYTYDAASNLKTRTDPESQLITYDYDELNRLTFKTYNGCSISACGGNVDYIYDPGSRLETVSNSLVSINYPVYDALNRVKQVTTTINSNNYNVSYDYDLSGNRKELTYPNGTLIKFNSDELNRLDTIKDSLDAVLFDFGYDPLSRRDSLSRPNGITTNYQYDTINRLTQIQHGSIATIDYPLYDNVGNRKQMTNSQGTHTYGYDNIYQLKTVTGPASATYNYDPVGNRTTVTETGTPSNYTPNNLNQYSSVDSTSYSYDSNGNLTNDGTYTYEYDYENRLIKATNIASTNEANYQYDPFGRRITKSGTLISTSQSYLYDGDQIIEAYPCDLTAGTCALNQSFLYGPGIDEPLDLTDHPTLTKHYYHQDGLGSVTQITDSSGAVQESYFYSPYGVPEIRDSSNTVIPQSLIGNLFLFTGREYDPETTLYYYRARYYNARIGRFLQRDPIGYYDDLNAYLFVRNNPLYGRDPFGLWTEDGIRTEWTRTPTGQRIISELPSSTTFKSYQQPPGDNANAYYVSTTNTIYIPQHFNDVEAAPTAAHEAQHAIDYKNKGPYRSLVEKIEREVRAKHTGLDVFKEMGRPRLPYAYEYELRFRDRNRQGYEEVVRKTYFERYRNEFLPNQQNDSGATRSVCLNATY